MKSAAGEANLTVVAIILVTTVVVVMTPIVSALMRNAKYTACCTDSGGIWQSGRCMAPTCDNQNGIFAEYDQCVAGANEGRSDANEHWFARGNCS